MAKRETIAQRGDKEFFYNGFVVIVPRSVLKAWEAQVDKHLEILKVLRRHYAQPTTEGIRYTLEFGRAPGEALSKTAEKMANPGVKKAVLELLKYTHYRDWHLSPIRDIFVRAVMMAALDGDQRFFRSLGERLKQKPIVHKALRNRLKELLLLNWVGEGICFCWFTDKAMLAFIKLTEGTAPFTMDAIRQERDRLELPKLRPALVRSIKQDGKRILLIPQYSKERPRLHSIADLTITDFIPDETGAARDNRQGEEQAYLTRLKKGKEFFDLAADLAMRERNSSSSNSQPL